MIDDGSGDDTAAIATAAGVRVLSSGGRGPSAARNLGVQHATHEIVAFTDADCVVPPQWLRALVDGLRTSRAAGAGGPQRNVFDRGNPREAQDLDLFFSLASVLAEYTRADDRPREVDHNASCNVAYVKHTLVEAGGFTEGLYPRRGRRPRPSSRGAGLPVRTTCPTPGSNTTGRAPAPGLRP